MGERARAESACCTSNSIICIGVPYVVVLAELVPAVQFCKGYPMEEFPSFLTG